MRSDKIASLFSKNIDKYDEYAAIQKIAAEKLIQIARCNQDIKSILEIGCGNGILTKKLIEKFPNCKIKCIDFAPHSIDYLSNLYSQIEFELVDFQNWEFDKKYDLVISNFTFHWIEDFMIKYIDKIMKNCKILIFTLPLDTSFQSIRKIYQENQMIDTFIDLPNINDIEKLKKFYTINYIIDTEYITYTNLQEFYLSIKKIGANYSNKVNLIKNMKNILKNNINSIAINYDILYCKIDDK